LSENAYKRALQFVASKVGVSLDGSGLSNKNGWGLPFVPPLKLPYPPFNYPPTLYYGTSANLGLVRAIPKDDILRLSINFRAGLKNTNQQIIAHAKNTVTAFKGEANVLGTYYEAFSYPEDDHLLDLLISCYKDVHGGRDPYLITSTGSTYLKLVSNFISYGPVDIYPDPSVNLYHQKNERVSIERLKDNLILYAYTLQKMLQMETAPLVKTR